MLSCDDVALVRLTEAGLPLVPDPYGEIAHALGRTRGDVIARMTALLEAGAIRRIGVIPNHYALGVVANGMSVWDIDDEAVAELGPKIGALSFVSHCYRRPRRLPLWPYNIFAMAHGRTRADVLAHVEEIKALVGPALRAQDVLFSTRVLKKTGLRLARQSA